MTQISRYNARVYKRSDRTPKRQMKSSIFGMLMALPGLLTLGIVVIYPLVYLVYKSFFRYNRFTPGIPTQFVGLQNYLDILLDQYVFIALQNTVVFVILSVALQLLLGFAVALLLYQPLRGRNVIRALLLSPIMIAPVVAGLQWRWLLIDQYGVINTVLKALHLPAPLWLGDPNIALWSIIIVATWAAYPFVMLVLVAALAGVPEEMIEAAMVDGANYWQRLRWILLPFLRPTILVILLIRVMDAFKVFDIVYVLTGGGPGVSTETISTYSYRLAFTNLDFESAGAMTVLSVLVVLVLSLLLVRLLSEPKEANL